MGNRGMAAVTGCVHDLNVFQFQEAATLEAARVARRDGLQSPWVVEVVVYNNAGPPSYLATISDGKLIAWEEKHIDEAVVGVDEPLSLGRDDTSLLIGFSYGELEVGLASGEYVLLLDQTYPEIGRRRVAARMEPGVVLIIEWRDPNDDGNWAWIKTSQLSEDWLRKIVGLLDRQGYGPNSPGSAQ